MVDSEKQIRCQVCQDAAVGFHCGAHVCEACKKFFIRCLKLKCGEKFRCISIGCCLITRATRTKCPCCRYKKCLQLRMYGPGSQNVSKEINHMPCQVCGAPSSGFHFGAITCEGCKGFFRRCLWNKYVDRCRCIQNGEQEGKCEVTWKTRNTCKQCRYNKCLEIGMEPRKSRIGRQSNLIKHKTHMMLNEIKLAKGLTVNKIFPLMNSSDEMLTPLLATHDHNQRSTKTCTNHSDIFAPNNVTSLSVGLNNSHFCSSDFSDDCTTASEDLQTHSVPQDSTCNLLTSPFNSKSTLPHSALSYHTQASDFPSNKRCRRQRSINERLLYFDSDSYQYDCMHAYKASLQSYKDSVLQDVRSNNPEMPSLEPILCQPVDVPRMSSKDSIVDLMFELYNHLDLVYKRFELPDIKSALTLELVWDFEMARLVRCTKLILEFAKKVPGFGSFTAEERIVVIQKSMFPIISFLLAIGFGGRTGYQWFGLPEEKQHIILELFDAFKYFISPFRDLANFVSRLSLDRVEISFLCALCLIDQGNKHECKEFHLNCLESYIKKKCGSRTERHVHVFRCLSELSHMANVYQFVLHLFAEDPKYAGLTKPNIFTEAVVRNDMHSRLT